MRNSDTFLRVGVTALVCLGKARCFEFGLPPASSNLISIAIERPKEWASCAIQHKEKERGPFETAP